MPRQIMPPRPTRTDIIRPTASSVRLREQEVEKGMMVEFDGGRKGCVDNLFSALNEFWVRDESTGDLVCSGASTDIRSFRADELIFTGEWAADADITEAMDIPAEVYSLMLERHGEDMLDMQEQINVPMRIELAASDNELGRLLIGPGLPPDVKLAIELVTNEMQTLLSEYNNRIVEQHVQAAERGLSNQETDPAYLQRPKKPSWLSDAEAAAMGLDVSKPVPSQARHLAHSDFGVRVHSDDSASQKVDPSSDSVSDVVVAYQLGWEAAMRKSENETGEERPAIDATPNSDPTSGGLQEPVKDSPDVLQESRSQNKAEASDENGAFHVTPEQQEQGSGNPDDSDNVKRTVLDWATDQDRFAHLPPLQQGWIRVISKSSGKIYYLNTVTGNTTFTEPVDLPPGWEQVKSRTTGQTYYWNSELQKSQFERPT